MPNKRAVILLSGGLDSATVLYLAKSQGYKCHCLVFDYGQRHRREIEAAEKIAKKAGASLQAVKISLPWKGSALLDKSLKIPLPANRKAASPKNGIPVTYVPGRNIIFLSFALSFAEGIGARAIFIGAHAQDYSGYPDCRPEFYRAFRKAAACGTKAGVENKGIEIKAPLIHKGKADIIRLGSRLKVPFELTWSCYAGGKKPCGKCDSCYYRIKGFKEAGIKQA
ncbi:MAG: 7-cyano-7-deazaguanine synthase QueC [Candidatus Omnitrophica bacterium]|nr:7-cyano-7-deazaguanine synthase QueC [Candidatus Omnitrophota bacterium]